MEVIALMGTASCFWAIQQMAYSDALSQCNTKSKLAPAIPPGYFIPK